MPYSNPEDQLAANRRWTAKNREYNAFYQIHRKYGITKVQYDEILQRQLGCCGVCRRPAGEFKIRLSVDHDHHTGAIRGLLCNHCNRFIIGRNRAGTGGVELFANASEYLKQDTGWFVPPKKKKRKKRANASRRTR